MALHCSVREPRLGVQGETSRPEVAQKKLRKVCKERASECLCLKDMLLKKWLCIYIAYKIENYMGIIYTPNIAFIRLAFYRVMDSPGVGSFAFISSTE